MKKRNNTGKGLFTLYLFLILLLLFGCRASIQKPGPYSPSSSEVLGPGKEQALFSRLKQWEDSFENLRGLVSLDLKSPKKNANLKEVIVLQKRSGLRIETLNPLGQPTMFLVAKDKDDLLIYFPFERRLEKVSATRENLYQWAGVYLDLSQVIKILSATVPLSQSKGEKSRWIHKPKEKRYVFQIFNEGAIREEIWFEAERFLPLRALLFEDDGTVFLDVSYTLYQSVQDSLFPYSVEIVLPAEKTRVHVVYKTVKINQELPEDIFTLPIPEKTQSPEK